MTDPSKLPYTLHQDVMIPMRDGVRLAADILFPLEHDGSPIPSLLIRTSWDKANEEWDPVRPYYPQQGYALVIQDLRSRFKSEAMVATTTLATFGRERTASTPSNGSPRSLGATDESGRSEVPTEGSSKP